MLIFFFLGKSLIYTKYQGWILPFKIFSGARVVVPFLTPHLTFMSPRNDSPGWSGNRYVRYALRRWKRKGRTPIVVFFASATSVGFNRWWRMTNPIRTRVSGSHVSEKLPLYPTRAATTRHNVASAYVCGSGNKRTIVFFSRVTVSHGNCLSNRHRGLLKT